MSQVNPCRLFVGSVPFSTSKQELQQHFAVAGELKDVYLPKSPDRPEYNKGFAFVEYQDRKSADYALETLNGSEINGRNLRVSVAAAKTFTKPTT